MAIMAVTHATAGQSLPDHPLLDTTVYGSGPDDSVTDVTEAAVRALDDDALGQGDGLPRLERFGRLAARGVRLGAAPRHVSDGLHTRRGQRSPDCASGDMP